MGMDGRCTVSRGCADLLHLLRLTACCTDIVAEDIVLPAEGLGIYRESVDAMWSGEIDCADWRHDLGAHTDPVVEDTENTGQIMWPCDRVAGLGEGPFHERSALLAKVLLGDDVRFDFDMLIWKDALTETETPWHQVSGLTD